MEIAIIDDDLEFAFILKQEILKVISGAVIEIYSDMNEKVFNFNYDIIFLDIVFGDVKSFFYGEQLMKTFPSLTLVNISSEDNLVFDSLKQRIFFFVRKSNLQFDLERFFEKYNKANKYQNSQISIKCNNEKIDILLKDIIYIESRRNQIMVYTPYTEYKVYMTLKAIMEMLDSTSFYKLNSSIIINLYYVSKVEDDKLILKNKRNLFFTRDSKSKFLKAYIMYRSEKLWMG